MELSAGVPHAAAMSSSRNGAPGGGGIQRPARICPVQVSRDRKKSGRTWSCPRPRRWWSPPTGTATADREPAMAADSSSFGNILWLRPGVVCWWRWWGTRLGSGGAYGEERWWREQTGGSELGVHAHGVRVETVRGRGFWRTHGCCGVAAQQAERGERGRSGRCPWTRHRQPS